jgi:NADPH:quinone reductase-like Zn-dependent oxidoreductase
MRAFAVQEFGKPGSVQDVPDPTPEGDQVLIRVKAAGVNPFDAAVVNGYIADFMEHRFPVVPGAEVSGEVVQAPEGSGFAPGDEVYGAVTKPFIGEGSWAELVTTPASELAKKPASLSHEDAAGVTIAGLTALEAVEAAGLKEGDTLVIVGATGGVGGYATQLAAARGIEVVAVSRGENADYAKELGAAKTVDYTQGDLVEQIRALYPDGVAGLLDTFNDAEGVSKLAGVVRTGGAVVTPKHAAGEDLEARGLRGVNANRAPLARLEDMNRLFESGAIKPLVRTGFPLEKAGDAIAEVSGGHVRGKLVVTVG